MISLIIKAISSRVCYWRRLARQFSEGWEPEEEEQIEVCEAINRDLLCKVPSLSRAIYAFEDVVLEGMCLRKANCYEDDNTTPPPHRMAAEWKLLADRVNEGWRPTEEELLSINTGFIADFYFAVDNKRIHDLLCLAAWMYAVKNNEVRAVANGIPERQRMAYPLQNSEN